MSLFKNANDSVELSNTLRLRFLKICLKSLNTVSEYLLKLIQNEKDDTNLALTKEIAVTNLKLIDLIKNYISKLES